MVSKCQTVFAVLSKEYQKVTVSRDGPWNLRSVPGLKASQKMSLYFTVCTFMISADCLQVQISGLLFKAHRIKQSRSLNTLIAGY